MHTARTGKPPDPERSPYRRLRETCGSLYGYAEVLAERLLIRPPHYETVGWKRVLKDLEARFGNVAEILEEPALREVEESTRRLLADIRNEDTFMPHWAADSVHGAPLLPRVPPYLTGDSRRDRGRLRRELRFYLEGPGSERARHALLRRPAAPEKGLRALLGYRRTRRVAGPVESYTGEPAPGFCPGSWRKTPRLTSSSTTASTPTGTCAASSTPYGPT